jgi:hypothetical protein
MASFYYDWLAQTWTPRPSTKRTAAQKSRCKLRHNLLSNLLVEIEHGGNGVARLYALLLARTLVATDEILMREFGKHVAEKDSEVERRVSAATQRSHE